MRARLPPRLPKFTGDWQRRLIHLTLNQDHAGSIPASPTRLFYEGSAAKTGPLRPRQLFARYGARIWLTAGLADLGMHSPFKRDEAGSIPASRTKEGCFEGASFNRIRTESSKL